METFVEHEGSEERLQKICRTDPTPPQAANIFMALLGIRSATESPRVPFGEVIQSRCLFETGPQMRTRPAHSPDALLMQPSFILPVALLFYACVLTTPFSISPPHVPATAFRHKRLFLSRLSFAQAPQETVLPYNGLAPPAGGEAFNRAMSMLTPNGPHDIHTLAEMEQVRPRGGVSSCLGSWVHRPPTSPQNRP
jgi:hypothetical protein